MTLLPDRFRQLTSGGQWHVSIATPRGEEWVNTGQPTLDLAQAVCSAANVTQWQVARSAEVMAQDLGAAATGTKVISPKLVHEWEAWFAPQRAPKTVQDYTGMLMACFTALFYWDKPMTYSSHESLSLYVNRGKFSSRNCRLAALKSFYGYCREMGYLAANPANLVRIRLREMTVAERTSEETIPMTLEDVRKLQAVEPLRVFWKVAIPLAYWTGLRLKDIACLEWDSIRETGLCVYQQKTGDKVEHKYADMHLEPEAEVEVRAALAVIPRVDGTYCFPKDRSKVLRGRQLTAQFRLVVRWAGVQGGKTFSGLRHARALRMQALGYAPARISAGMGHRSWQTTQIYLDHAEPAAIP